MYNYISRNLIISPINLLVALVLSLNAVAADLFLANNISRLFSLTDHELLIAFVPRLLLFLAYSILSSLVNNYYIALITFRAGNNLFRKLISSYVNSPRFIRLSLSQESVSNLAIVQITNICGGIILPILTMTSDLVLISALLAYSYIYLTTFTVIVTIIFIPLLYILFFFTSRLIQRAGLERLRSSQSLSSEIYNLSSKSLLFKSIKLTSAFSNILAAYDLKFRNAERRFFILNAVPSNAIDALLALAIVSLSFLSIYEPAILPPTSLPSLGFIALRLVSKLKSLGSSFNKYKSYKSSLDEYTYHLNCLNSDNCAELEEKTTRTSKKIDKLNLKINQKEYLTTSLQSPAYSNTLSRIQACKKTIIQGRSGAGKSTFLQLLAESYVDQTLIPNFTYEKGDCILVDQAAILFPWSILANITLARSVSETEKVAINKLIFLYRLPFTTDDQFSIDNTDFLDSRMPNLSGGEAQRFSLIRALYKYHDLILLDEPLSSQDPSMAKIVTQSINDYHRMHPTSTIVMISHVTNQFLLDDWNKVVF